MKKREIVLITIFLVMLANAVYYLAYFAPIYAESTQLEQLNAERAAAVETAIQDLMVYKSVSEDKASREPAWAELVEDIPLTITPEEFIRRTDSIISPRSRELRLELAGGRRGRADEGSGPTQTRAITISFKATYREIQDILADFARANIANRVSDISLSEDSELPGNYDVTINAEFLTRSEYVAAPAPQAQ
jgi:hypothetical protein